MIHRGGVISGSQSLPAIASQPFTMQFGPGRISGTFNIELVDDADEMIKMINAMKGFLKKKEAAN